jgi:hypothetical protein
MKRNILAVLWLAVALPFLPQATGNCDEQTPSFTNEDIEKYKGQPSSYTNQDIERYSSTTGNSAQGSKKEVKDENIPARKEAQQKKDQESWCKRATALKRKVERCRREASDTEQSISQENESHSPSAKKKNSQRSRLKKTKDALARAEEDLNDLEYEAQRKGIRPGWLRCQFD